MPQRVFIRTGDTVAHHWAVDAREILRGGESSAYTGPVRLRIDGAVRIASADAATSALLDDPAAGVQLIPNVAGLA